ncbi:MAG: efflux RND transporter periplasmic adaptor subunit [Pseudomonadota bacterium]
MNPRIQLTSSTAAALGILALVVIYFLVRGVFGAGNAAETAEGEDEERLFTVIAAPVAPQEWRDTILLRGRTEAERKVTVRAETAGAVAATPTAAGALVSEGETLCRLRIDARRARLAEARAARKRAQLDFDAATKLAEEGFRSETSLAAFRAALDLAIASVEQAELDIERVDIKAPFDGVFDDRLAEIGDYLRVGDPCGVVIQRSPYLIVGAVSERDVAKLSVGDRGLARLATGETVEGKVRYIATAADPATRTFDVELQVPNEDGRLRDGVTAEFEIYASASNAHLLPRSALTLNDEGEIGVRTVGGEGLVAFAAVRLLGESEAGVWVAGIDGAPEIIVRGQDFVRAGQRVKVSPPPDGAAKTKDVAG